MGGTDAICARPIQLPIAMTTTTTYFLISIAGVGMLLSGYAAHERNWGIYTMLAGVITSLAGILYGIYMVFLQ